MAIFLTGATEYLGSAIVPELIANGSRVIAHTRSADSVAALTKAGATPVVDSASRPLRAQ